MSANGSQGNWDGWTRDAVTAWDDRADGKPDRFKALWAELREALAGALPEFVDMRTGADIPAVLAEAAGAADSDAAWAVLQEKLARRFPTARGIMAGQGDPKPEPLLWGAGVRGGVLCRSEVAVLSGAGGRGKSTLALQWALAGALAEAGGQRHGDSGGLGVRAGKAAILSYEDSAWRLANRASKALALASLAELAQHLPRGNTAADAANVGVTLAELRGWPLFGVAESSHALTRPQRLDAWAHAWGQIAQHKADIVIIDPAMSAYVADPNAVPFVRLFMDALYEAAQEHGCGVLLIAHSTKAARRTKDADATGNVAGSAAWTDAARGVLTLDYPPPPSGERPDAKQARLKRRVLRCEKANYSRVFECELAEAGGQDGPFRGFERAEDKSNMGATNGSPTGNYGITADAV